MNVVNQALSNTIKALTDEEKMESYRKIRDKSTKN